MKSAKTEILQILFINDKSKSWLANKLGISSQKLDYRLNRANDMPLELYQQIMKIFKKEGFITSDNDQCVHLLNQTLEIDALIGHSLTLLNSNVKAFTEDNILDFRERRKLLEIIDKIKSEFLEQIDEIEKVIEGR